MDFHSMKRKELQALCKKHKIPANLSNLEMANRLAEVFEEKGNSVVQGLVKEQDGNGGEIESANVVMNGKGKKVRFSPEHELIEFTRSQAVKRRSRRVSVSGKNSLPVEIVDNGELNNENVGKPGRAMRSRGSELTQGEVNEKKRGRKGLKTDDSKTNAAAVESDKDELREGTVENPSRVLRPRGSELIQEEVNEKKRGRKGVKTNDSKNKAAPVESDNGELRGSTVDNPGRVLRSRGKVQNAISTRGRKRAKVDNTGDEKALDNADDDKLIEEKLNSPVRVTRFGGQKLKEASAKKKETTGRKVVKNNDDAALVSAETDDSTVVVTEGKLAECTDESKKGNRKGMKEGLGNKKTAEVHVTVEPQIFLRRATRNGNKVDVSELTNDDISKHVKGANKELRRAPKLLEAEGSGEVVESTESKVDLDGRVVIPIEKPVALEQRRSDRRKSVISSHGRGGNNETKASVLQLNADGVTKDDKKDVQHVGVTRRTRRKTMSLKPVGNDRKLDVDATVPQLSTAGEVCEDEKVSQPTGVTRRSKRKTSLTMVSTNENSDNDAAMKNFETDEQMSKPCLVKQESAARQVNARRTKRNASTYPSLETITEFGVDPIIEQKNEASKRRRGPVSGRNVDDTNNNSSSLTHSTRKGSRNKIKAEPAAVIGELADKSKTPSRWEESNMSDASSNECLEVGESLLVNSQLSVVEGSESANNVGLSSDRSAKKINKDDVGLTPGTFDSELIGGNEPPNLHEKAESISEILNKDCADLREQTSPSKLMGVKEVHSSEYDVTNIDKEDPEAQLLIKNVDSSCDDSTDNQAILEDSRDAGFAEVSTSVEDGLLHGDQTDFKADGDESKDEPNVSQPSLDVVDRVGELEDVSVQENLESREDCDISPSIVYHRSDMGQLESLNNTGDSIRYTAPKSGETGVSEPCEKHADCTDTKSELELKEPTSGMLGRNPEGNTAEGDEFFSPKDADPNLDENDEDRRLKDCETESNEDSEFGLDGLFDGERSARTSLQDREIFPGENPVMRSDEQETYNDSPTASPITIEANRTEIDEDGSSKDDGRKCDEVGECTMSTLLDTERVDMITPQDREIFSCESPIKNFDEEGVHDFPSITPTTTGNFSEIKVRSDHKADRVTEEEETYVNKDVQSALSEADQSGLKVNKSTKDEDPLCSISNLFDAERSGRTTSQDSGSFLTKHFLEDSIKQGRFHDSPVDTRANCSEVNISAGSSSLKEISPSELNSNSELQGSAPIRMCEIIDNEPGTADTIRENEAASFHSNISGTGASVGKINTHAEHQIFNQADEHTNQDVTESAEKPKSPFGDTTGIANTTELQEAWTSGSDIAPMSVFKTSDRGKTNVAVEGSISNEDANNANCDKDKEGVADEYAADLAAAMNHGVSDIGVESLGDLKCQDRDETEHQSTNSPAAYVVSDVGEKPTEVDSSESCEKDKEVVADDYAADLAAAMDHTVSDIEVESLGELKCQDIDETGYQCTNSPVAHVVSDVDEKPTDVDSSENCDEDKEGIADEYTEGLAASMNHTVNDIAVESLGELKCQDIDETEYQCTNTPAAHVVSDVGEKPTDADSSESWTEIELNNLFQTHGGTPTGPNNSSGQGTEIANLTMSMNKSTPRSCLTLKNMEVEAERESESEKTTNEKVHLSETGSDVSWEENHLKLLFATPMKIVNPCEAEETSVRDRKLDGVAISLKECVGTVEENVAMQIKFDEKLHEVGSVELVSARTRTGFSENDDSEACEEQLAESPCESMKETNYISEDNEQVKGAIDNGNKRTDENTINLSGSPRNLDKIEGCHKISVATDLLENLGSGSRFSPISEGGMAQISEAAFELSYADFQKSENPENIQSLISSDKDGNNNMESSNDKHGSRLDLEVADIGGFYGEKDAANEEQGSPADCAESDILSSLATLLGDDGNGGTEKSEAGTAVLNVETDHEKNDKEIIAELNLQENLVDFKNDNISVLNASASECDEPLKESEVADTIQEYIDSESSLSVDVEDSETTLQIGASTHLDEKSTYENAVACDPEEDIDGRIVKQPLIESFEEENKEPEDKTLFTEPTPESEKPVDDSPACINFFDEGSPANKPSVEAKAEELEEIMSSGSASVNNTLSVLEKESKETSSKLLCSTAKNSRTILIHGTPRKKLLTAADMKENVPMHKSSNMGDFTTARPRKRKALQDVQWK